jgi:multidrug efflux system outer membrane protein
MSFGLVPMLSGCITADRPDLGFEIPWKYREAPRLQASPPPSLDWWRGFRSKELTDLIEEAQTANFDVAAAVGRIVQADAQSKIAGAPLLPSLTYNTSVTRTRASQANGGSGGGSESVAYRMALSASYEIDFWGKNRAASESAQLNAIAVRFDRDVVNLSTIVTVGTAYFLVLSSQEHLKLARQNVAAAERVLTLIKQRQEAGTASDFDVAQQETLVASQRAQIPNIDLVLRQNKNTLALLVGRTPESMQVRGGSLYGMGIPRPGAGLPSELLYQRPDIRAAEALLASSEASVVSARAAFFPSITLTGQYGILSAALKNLFTPQAIFYTIAAQLTQPVFDGWRLEGQLEQAKGRQVELMNVYRKAVVLGFVDVENALIAVADTNQREQLQQQVVNSSRRAFELGETRLREGTVDLVALLVIQQALFTAQDNLIDARLARLQAVLSLYQALGGSWLPRPPAAQAATPQ